MSEPEALGDEAVALLLALLESEEPAIVGEAAALMRNASAPLIARGLLVDAGYVDVIGIETDDGEELVTVGPVGDEGSLGYRGSHGGFVVVPRERLIRRQVEVPRTLAAMLSEFDLPKRWNVTVLAEGYLWETPPVRIGKAAGRHSIWLARRLSYPAAANAVLQTIDRRPPTDGLLILTTTPADHVAITPPSTAMVVSVHDVLRRPDSLAVHAGILERRLQGRAAPRDQAAPAWLSPDGRTLRFRCGTEFSFHGAAHISALRKLVDAQRRGRGVLTSDLTPHRSLENLFGHRRWQELKPFLERRHDGWRFKD